MNLTFILLLIFMFIQRKELFFIEKKTCDYCVRILDGCRSNSEDIQKCLSRKTGKDCDYCIDQLVSKRITGCRITALLGLACSIYCSFNDSKLETCCHVLGLGKCATKPTTIRTTTLLESTTIISSTSQKETWNESCINCECDLETCNSCSGFECSECMGRNGLFECIACVEDLMVPQINCTENIDYHESACAMHCRIRNTLQMAVHSSCKQGRCQCTYYNE